MGHPETKRDGLAGSDREHVQARVTEEVARRVRGRRRQRGPAGVEELYAGIANRRAAAGAGVTHGEAELPMAGGALLAEERERQTTGDAGGRATRGAGGQASPAGAARGGAGRPGARGDRR